LINALSLNHLSFAGAADINAGWLARLLGLFINKNDDVHRQYVKAFEGLEARVINRRIPGEGPVSYGRGLEIFYANPLKNNGWRAPNALACQEWRAPCFVTKMVVCNALESI